MPRPYGSTGDQQASPQRDPRLLALHPTCVEGHWDLRDQTGEFYGHLIGLGEPGVHIEPAGTLLLVFRNDGPDLQVRLTDQPVIWANRPRVVVEVPDLEQVRQRLMAAGVEHQPISGWSWADRRIGMWDPSGNRLEVKRLWPSW